MHEVHFYHYSKIQRERNSKLIRNYKYLPKAQSECQVRKKTLTIPRIA